VISHIGPITPAAKKKRRQTPPKIPSHILVLYVLLLVLLVLLLLVLLLFRVLLPPLPFIPSQDARHPGPGMTAAAGHPAQPGAEALAARRRRTTHLASREERLLVERLLVGVPLTI